jgi:O-antigen ligase
MWVVSMSASSAHNPTGTLALPLPRQAWLPATLLLLIFIGCAITLIDGLSTKYNDDWEYKATEALTYKPATAAILFAAITFPLLFRYARQQNASRSEALILWYVLGVTAYTKDFAYLKIPGIPLYITDYVLSFLLVRYFVWPKFRWYSLRSWPMLSAAALLCVGTVAAIRGFLGGQSPLFVLRDFGLVVYVLFLPLGILVFRNWESIRRLLLIFCIGSAMVSLFAFGYWLSNPGERRYVMYPVVLSGAFMASFAGAQNRIFDRKLGWILTAVNGFGLLLANSRAEFVSVIGACGVMFLLGPSVQRSTMISRIKLLLKVLCVAVLLIAVFMQTKAGAKLADKAASQFLSGVLNPTEDPTAEFRFLAWAEAFNRFVQHPILGEGYGIPFTFGDVDTDPRPHNTYLTFLYKTGLVGFLVLVTVLVVFFLKSLNTVRRCRETRGSVFLYMIALALLAISASGLFTLLFESPFDSAPYWILVGAGYRSLHLLGAKVQISNVATATTTG